MKNQSFQLLDTVIIRQGLPQKNVRQWAIGTIVEILDEDVFLVEFADSQGREYAMLALRAEQLAKVENEPALAF